MKASDRALITIAAVLIGLVIGALYGIEPALAAGAGMFFIARLGTRPGQQQLDEANRMGKIAAYAAALVVLENRSTTRETIIGAIETQITNLGGSVIRIEE